MATRKIRADARPLNGRSRIAVTVTLALIVGLGLVACTSDDPPEPTTIAPTTGQPAASPTDAGGDSIGDVVFLDIATGEKRIGPDLGPAVDHVAVSQDGTKIAYISWEVGGPELVHVADIDGSNVQAFPSTEAPEAARSPSWSPDGSTIVYQAWGVNSNLGELFLLDVSTGDVRQLTDLGVESDHFRLMAPTFDPSGEAVIFMHPTPAAPPRWGLWSVPVEGGDPTLIRRDAGWPDVSPDGTTITFAGAHVVDGELTGGRLWTSNPDGSGAERLVEGPVSLSRWSPDGTRILYADEDVDSLKILDLTSGETTDVDQAADWSDWLDDDTLVIDGTP